MKHFAILQGLPFTPSALGNVENILRALKDSVEDTKDLSSETVARFGEAFLMGKNTTYFLPFRVRQETVSVLVNYPVSRMPIASVFESSACLTSCVSIRRLLKTA